MEKIDGVSVARRSLIKGSVALAGVLPFSSFSQDVESNVARPLRSERAVVAIKRGNIALMFLNRPLLGNFLSRSDYLDLLDEFRALDDDESIHSIVLAAHGEHFSTGIVDGSIDRIRTLREIDIAPLSPGLSTKPVIAAIHGQATGLGAALSLHADIRVANANAVFRWPNRSHVGTCLARLAEEIGRANAQRFLLTGDDLGAHEAWRMGFVQHVAANREEALVKAVSIAEAIARRRIAPNVV